MKAVPARETVHEPVALPISPHPPPQGSPAFAGADHCVWRKPPTAVPSWTNDLEEAHLRLSGSRARLPMRRCSLRTGTMLCLAPRSRTARSSSVREGGAPVAQSLLGTPVHGTTKSTEARRDVAHGPAKRHTRSLRPPAIYHTPSSCPREHLPLPESRSALVL